jgi:hypothetical protein
MYLGRLERRGEFTRPQSQVQASLQAASILQRNCAAAGQKRDYRSINQTNAESPITEIARRIQTCATRCASQAPP